ncbi:MAG: metal-dependent hydrolase [Anaerolineae bacterium]|nr:metal-dependent hydrolase [Anaerolineae bacterium]
MKGIAHFVTGVAIATFFPEVVHQAADGSLLPMLGGIAGILPDTLDFKLARYFETYHLEIDPGPEPNARQIADGIVGAMRRAYETGTPQNVALHTIRLGADLWRQYVVRFNPLQNEVVVRIGPVVNTGQVPFPGSDPEGDVEARLKVGVPMVHTYDAENRVDIFSGPSFRFERQGDELHVHFLDWHRRWSHSLTLAAALGLGAAGIAALVEWLAQGALSSLPLWAGLVTGLGFSGHVLEDQLGFMGSNLLYPFTKRRAIGLRLLRSGDPIPNFLTVWVSGALILFNLDRFSVAPTLDAPVFLLLALVLPVVILGGLYQLQRRAGEMPAPAQAQKDIISETEEVETA